MPTDVTATLSCNVTADAEIVFSVAVAEQYDRDEQLAITLDGAPLTVTEVADRHGTRLHVVRATEGKLRLDYRARVTEATPLSPAASERLEYLRPSRYAESDRIFPAAADLFADLEGETLLDAVTEWVGARTAYVSGSSRHTDGAVDTYLNRRGVCRDFAHLVIAFLRARSVPARLASVYAPGLSPMDFHAVAEAWLEDRWQVLDATAMAPRQAMVRIATGRDAADTAFMTVQSGQVQFEDLQVGAVTGGDLPTDDLDALVVLP